MPLITDDQFLSAQIDAKVSYKHLKEGAGSDTFQACIECIDETLQVHSFHATDNILEFLKCRNWYKRLLRTYGRERFFIQLKHISSTLMKPRTCITGKSLIIDQHFVRVLKEAQNYNDVRTLKEHTENDILCRQRSPANSSPVHRINSEEGHYKSQRPR